MTARATLVPATPRAALHYSGVKAMIRLRSAGDGIRPLAVPAP